MEYPKDLMVFALRECCIQMNLMTANLHLKREREITNSNSNHYLNFKLQLFNIHIIIIKVKQCINYSYVIS